MNVYNQLLIQVYSMKINSKNNLIVSEKTVVFFPTLSSIELIDMLESIIR